MKGVPQGSPLSCLLFVFAFNALFVHLHTKEETRNVGYRLEAVPGHAVPRISRTGYVDDLELFAKSYTGICAQVKALYEFTDFNGGEVS